MEVQLHRLGRAREVRHAQDSLVLVLPQVGEDLAVAWVQKLKGSPPEGLVRLADGYDPLHPVQERARAAPLRLDVDRLVAVDRVHDGWQVQACRVRPGEA